MAWVELPEYRQFNPMVYPSFTNCCRQNWHEEILSLHTVKLQGPCGSKPLWNTMPTNYKRAKWNSDGSGWTLQLHQYKESSTCPYLRTFYSHCYFSTSINLNLSFNPILQWIYLALKLAQICWCFDVL